MSKRESTIKPLVAIRASDYHSIAFNSMVFEGELKLLMSCEDGGGTTSFFFNDAREARLFAQRVLDAAGGYDE